jgi:glycine cleavage system H protein
MSKAPPELKYAKSHEWIRVEGDEATIGITDHAQEALNDIVYVELPKLHSELAAGKAFGVVESVKSVSDLYMPVGGKVMAVNGDLEDEPEMLNEDPYGKGWLIRVKMSNKAELNTLLSADGYLKTL